MWSAKPTRRILAARSSRDVDSVQTTALHPSDEIIEIATRLAADMLVLSTHGYKGWKHMLLGSHAEKILKEAPCPVLVAR